MWKEYNRKDIKNEPIDNLLSLIFFSPLIGAVIILLGWLVFKGINIRFKTIKDISKIHYVCAEYQDVQVTEKEWFTIKPTYETRTKKECVRWEKVADN